MISSILDTDLYKLTMAQAALKLYPKAKARYEFINRDPSRKFTPAFLCRFHDALQEMSRLALNLSELVFLEENCLYLELWFLSWLGGYHFNPDQVTARLGGKLSDQLVVEIEGLWYQTILWEVPLLAIISELYFEDVECDHIVAAGRASAKRKILEDNHCSFADFGTRRRFSSDVHYEVLTKLQKTDCCVGTSNVRLAMDRSMRPIGTMAHEWVQGLSALRGLRYANRYAMEAWMEVYNGSLGIALTDTFGSKAFFRDFSPVLARLFDGVRQDSGDPFQFANQTVDHYQRLGIAPGSKSIIFSDSLNVEKAVALQNHCDGLGIKCAFGIGTNFTNDVPGVKPLNMVIKLREIDGIEVVKLSDDPGKTIGSKEAVDVAKWTFQENRR